MNSQRLVAMNRHQMRNCPGIIRHSPGLERNRLIFLITERWNVDIVVDAVELERVDGRCCLAEVQGDLLRLFHRAHAAKSEIVERHRWWLAAALRRAAHFRDAEVVSSATNSRGAVADTPDVARPLMVIPG